MGHGQHNRFNQLLNLLVAPANVAVVFRGLFVYFHGLDPGVEFSWQRFEHQVAVFVDTNQITGFDLHVQQMKEMGETENELAGEPQPLRWAVLWE